MPPKKQSVTVLWNSAAGWDEGESSARQVEAILSKDERDLDFRRVNKTTNIVDESRKLIRAGSQILVAAGGDGTVNAVASALVNTKAALAVIPAGTLNHFARDLSIPLDPRNAAAAINNGHEIRVDVGCVNGRIFINNSVLGLYPVYSAARDAYQRHGLGGNRVARFIALLRAIFRVFWHLPHLKLRLQMSDGTACEVQTPFVLVANNEHEVENWNIGHRKSIDKGHLWVYVMRRSTRWSMLRFFASFLIKRFSRYEAFDIYRVNELRVDTKSKFLRVSLDGEIVRLQTPLTYRSMPQSLRVIAPKDYPALEPA